jgi:gamma-glutamyltranspeptidase/glutathione hydrolase
MQDLAEHQVDWIEPISIDFGEVTVHELPPNGQGIATLIALGILDRLPLPVNADDPQTIHSAVEAMRLALADLHNEVTDPIFMKVSVGDLLSPTRLDQLASRIKVNVTSGLIPKPLKAHGTVYVASADREGMMVSFIQSNFMGFGSGVVVPGTGIALNNRGAGFSIERGHPNEIAPRKRVMNTIIPGFMTQRGKPLAAFGVMGGAMQAQAHTQVVLRMSKYGQNVQAAVDAPRWMVDDDGVLAVEHSAPDGLVRELASKGHRIRRMLPLGLDLGAAQIIQCLPNGGYVAATESRREGIAALL